MGLIWLCRRRGDLPPLVDSRGLMFVNCLWSIGLRRISHSKGLGYPDGFSHYGIGVIMEGHELASTSCQMGIFR